MFAGTSSAATSAFKLILGISLCTLGGAMLYVYYKNRDEDDEVVGADGKKEQQPQKKKKPKETTIKLEVANDKIPLLIGRNGGNLSLIEEKTNTKIRLRDKNEKCKICDITGTPDAVKEARALLLKEIERSPMVKEEMYVPQSVCGKIMGRCGEAMQEICRKSLAKMAIDSGGRYSGVDKRRIIITGTRPQVNVARKMIEDKIAEDEEEQKVGEEVEQHREPRRSPVNSLSSSMYSSQNSLSSHLPPREKLLASRGEEKPMEVYVSAIASPSKFWVQLIGPQSKKLDDMVLAMTEYYSEADNRANHQINEPYLGQIVAAVFKFDGKWYRAEIVGILPNQYNPNEVVLDLYFVDYGDSEYVAPHEVFELRTDFLMLRFQAVECFMANIKSTIISDADTWESQSIQKFEELTQVANWKKLIARVVTYKDRPKPVNGTAQNSISRGNSPIPGVELFDLTEGVEVNLGHMLISHGYALPADDPRPSSPFSSYSSPETSLYQPNPVSPSQSPPPPILAPLATPSDKGILSAAEDAVLEEQLQHLRKNNNLYLNGDATTHPAKLSTENFNGNYQQPKGGDTSAVTTNGTHSTNGNLHR